MKHPKVLYKKGCKLLVIKMRQNLENADEERRSLLF